MDLGNTVRWVLELGVWGPDLELGWCDQERP